MGNVTFKVDDTYSLSVYQDEQTKVIECVPVYTEGGLIGEPLYFEHFEELIEMYDSIMNGDFKIWTDRYEVEWE